MKTRETDRLEVTIQKMLEDQVRSRKGDEVLIPDLQSRNEKNTKEIISQLSKIADHIHEAGIDGFRCSMEELVAADETKTPEFETHLKSVTFSNGCCETMWSDGNGVVTSIQDSEAYLRKGAFAMCVLKKLLGERFDDVMSGIDDRVIPSINKDEENCRKCVKLTER